MRNFYLIIIFLILIFITNTHAQDNILDETKDGKKILKIGILLPLSGEHKKLGHIVLNSIKMAVKDINKENITILPKDSGSNALTSFKAAQEFANEGIKIVLGPIFFKNTKNLENIDDVTFLSLSNMSEGIPKNVITLGVNIDTQLITIMEHIKKSKLKKTVFLVPQSKFENIVNKSLKKNNFEIQKIVSYSTNPKKITQEIENLTYYGQRKLNLKKRVQKLKNSDQYKDKKELKLLEKKFTLGSVNFDSVIIADFGERLKSILSSFDYVDVTNKTVTFYTLNQWFDESLLNETSLDKIIYPSIDLNEFNIFRKKYFNTFETISNEISVLAYDAIGLIYYNWLKNEDDFNTNKFYLKYGFRGKQGDFFIKKNKTFQKLNMYQIQDKKLVKID